MKKNTAGQKWTVFAFDETDNTAVTGDSGNITAKVSIDGAAGTVTTDANPTEIEDGYYAFDIDADETNGDYLLIMPDSSTGNVQVIGCPAGVWTTFPIESADSGSTEIARTGADSDTLETLSDQMDSILDDTSALTNVKITQTLNLTGSGNIGIDWANVENPTTALDLTQTDIQLVDTCSVNSDMRGTDNAGLETTLIDIKGTGYDSATDSLKAIRDRGDAAWVTGGDATDTKQDTIIANQVEMQGAGFDSATDSLKAIRDRGDAAWTTGAGGDATEANQDVIIANQVEIQGASFDSATDSLKAIRDRGDGFWKTGGAGSVPEMI